MAPKRALHLSERGAVPSRASGSRHPGAGAGAARGVAAPFSPPRAREDTLPDVHRDVTGTAAAVALDLSARARELLLGAFGLWNQKAAANHLRVPVSTFKEWMTGRRRISTDHLSHLFTILGPGFRAACLAPWEDAGPTVAGFRLRSLQPKE